MAGAHPNQELEAGPSLVKGDAQPPGAARAKSSLKAMAEWGWVGAIVGLFALHAVHLRADFPNYSPWMDYAKYTDEGWYGNAAIEAFLRGSWYVPGDFNTAVALPVWPFLEWLLFHFTGVSLIASRALAVAIFGGSVGLTYMLVRGRQISFGGRDIRPSSLHTAPEQQPRWVALLAASIVASSSFLYCFSRLAILEPLVILLMLACFWLALRSSEWKPRARTLGLVALGLLVCVMILTKTTSVVLLPAIFYLVWDWRDRRRSLCTAAIVGASALVPWLGYYLILVRPHYLSDYRYLFEANVYIQPTTVGGWVMAFWYGLHGALWIGGTLFVVAGVVLLLSTAWLRPLWRNRLFTACVLAIAFHLLFIGYHNNMQTRYYTVAASPMAIVVALGLGALLRQQRVAGGILLAALVASMGYNAAVVIGYARHPQYTFVNAAENLTRYIDQHPNGNRMLLSISGNDIGLITGLPSICDDFGTLGLPARIHLYQPGWYAAWNELDPGTLEDLHTQFSLEEVARFPAFDDDDRNMLILYKLHPLPLSQQRMDEDGAVGTGAAGPNH